MDTQAKEGSYHRTLICSRTTTTSTIEDEAGMGPKDKWIYTGTMPITKNKCTMQKSRTTRTYLEEGDSNAHTLKGKNLL